MSESVESDYYAFMSFDADNARRVLRFYSQFFTTGPVLELACGPGVFLSVLREEGVAARGVDIDDGMVQTAREAGHDVVLDDALAHMRSLPDASLRGLFCAHFLEHLPAPTVQSVSTRPGACSNPVARSWRRFPMRPACPCSATTSGATPRTCAFMTRWCCSSSPAKPGW